MTGKADTPDPDCVRHKTILRRYQDRVESIGRQTWMYPVIHNSRNQSSRTGIHPPGRLTTFAFPTATVFCMYFFLSGL